MMADTSKLPISRVDELIDKLNEINNNFNIINNKLDSMKYVIESGSNENNTQWYKIWSDGWIEQGGYVSNPSSNETVTLLKSYNNINYSIQCQYAHDSNSTGRFLSVGNKTNSTFMVRTGASNLDNWSGSYPVPFYWEVKGY
jgi:hypothetical protein